MELAGLTIHALHAKLVSGEVSAMALTEAVLTRLEDAQALFSHFPPRPMATIPLLARGRVAIVEANAALGLALAEDEIDYLDANFRRIRTLENNYLQDRDAMKHGSHTGIAGIPNQDIAMWETMGPIADRSRERLGASDMAIVQFRRMMVDAARKVRDGGPAIGTCAA